MSYTDQKEYVSAIAAAFSSTGIKLTYSPGIRPMKLRAVAVVVSTDMTVTPPVLTIRHRPTAGSATGQTTVDTITVPLAQTAGKLAYVEDLDQLVKPGEHIVFDVTTAATAGVGDIVAEFDPSWESLANNTNAVLSA